MYIYMYYFIYIYTYIYNTYIYIYIYIYTYYIYIYTPVCLYIYTYLQYMHILSPDTPAFIPWSLVLTSIPLVDRAHLVPGCSATRFSWGLKMLLDLGGNTPRWSAEFGVAYFQTPFHLETRLRRWSKFLTMESARHRNTETYTCTHTYLD